MEGDNRAVRWSPASQQEAVSRAQFEEAMSCAHWLVDRTTTDVGIDCYITAYDGSQTSGLMVSVQIKSVSDWGGHIRGDGSCSYSLDVKDLEFWERQALPVFVFLWNVQLATGRWVEVRAAIETLDAGRRQWRSQKSVRVRFGSECDTSEQGMQRLRRTAAWRVVPLVAPSGAISCTFTVAIDRTSADGVAVAEAWDRFRRAGTPVSLDARYIQNLRFEPRVQRLFGTSLEDSCRVALHSRSLEPILAAEVSITNAEGASAEAGYVELWQEAKGTDLVTLSNDRQQIPLFFRMEIDLVAGATTVTPQIRPRRVTARQARTALSFMQAMDAGGRLVVRDASVGTTLAQGEIARDDTDPFDPAYMRLIDSLQAVGAALGEDVWLPDGWTISANDENTIRELVDIVSCGRLRADSMTGTVRTERWAVERMVRDPGRRRFEVELHSADCIIVLWDNRIRVGPVRFDAEGGTPLGTRQLRALLVESPQTEYVSLPVAFANCREEYTRFSGEEQRGCGRIRTDRKNVGGEMAYLEWQ